MEQVLYWNDVALEANRVSFTDKDKSEQGGPTLSSRAMGIVHLAMHDAFVGGLGTATYGAYLGSDLPTLPSVQNIDVARAAMAGAAHTALVALYPKQKPFFDTKLNSITHILTGKEQGYQFGCEVGRVLLEKRANDPDNSDQGYLPHTGRGKHKSDPDNQQGYLAPFYGAKSSLFSTSTRYGLEKPPFLTNPVSVTYDPEYLRALRQVRGKGIATELMGGLPGSFNKRNVDETLIGIFWAYDGANSIGTPPKLYNQIVRNIAINNNNLLTYGSLEERNVRLFAMVNVAMADAGILAWEQKYIHNFWRPVNGIREHDKSMGSTGLGNNNIIDDCDPLWLPLGAPKSNANGQKNFTPDFPAYPSGHATFGAAALHTVRLFFGIPAGNYQPDNLYDGCDFISDEFNGVTKDNNNTIRPCHVRNFPSGLWQMIVENGLSRVFLGVHWFFDAFELSPNALSSNSADGRNVALNEVQINIDLTAPTAIGIGGVPLGLAIAEDIFANQLSQSNV